MRERVFCPWQNWCLPGLLPARKNTPESRLCPGLLMLGSHGAAAEGHRAPLCVVVSQTGLRTVYHGIGAGQPCHLHPRKPASVPKRVGSKEMQEEGQSPSLNKLYWPKERSLRKFRRAFQSSERSKGLEVGCNIEKCHGDRSVGKVVRQSGGSGVTVLHAECDYLSLVPKIHMVKRGTLLLQTGLWLPPQMCHSVCVHPN